MRVVESNTTRSDRNRFWVFIWKISGIHIDLIGDIDSFCPKAFLNSELKNVFGISTC